MTKTGSEDINKKLKGQFFTITNPFNIDIFYKWFNLIPDEIKNNILEPFAGSNNIVEMIKNLGIKSNWHCYDIELQKINKSSEFIIQQRDTIKSFPSVAKVAITNPPYLAKNSATRMGLNYDYPEYDDLYKKCLEVMLNNCDYVAAIIPESFITSELFHDRLYAAVSLTCKMFEDTDCPVCLALFISEKDKKDLKLDNDFLVYRQNKYINKYSIVKKFLIISSFNDIEWKMNDKKGSIGIRCIDNTKTSSIEFIPGIEISEEKIKVSSRSLTRVSGLPEDVNLKIFIAKCNQILDEYRKNTSDIFLTSFKGLRDDGSYRRRLDFNTAKAIMNKAMESFKETNKRE